MEENKMSKKPQTIKAGRGIRAKVWSNENDKGAWKSVTIKRTYKDEDGKFHDSDSFSGDDLLHVAFLAFNIYSRMQRKKEE